MFNKKKIDFDCLIPDITKGELTKVLNDSKISPFIFYGNINDNEKYDIISEIKQNFHDNEQHIIQAKKYVKINKKLDNDEKLNDDLGLEMENKKNNIICV